MPYRIVNYQDQGLQENKNLNLGLEEYSQTEADKSIDIFNTLFAYGGNTFYRFSFTDKTDKEAKQIAKELGFDDIIFKRSIPSFF